MVTNERHHPRDGERTTARSCELLGRSSSRAADVSVGNTVLSSPTLFFSSPTRTCSPATPSRSSAIPSRSPLTSLWRALMRLSGFYGSAAVLDVGDMTRRALAGRVRTRRGSDGS